MAYIDPLTQVPVATLTAWLTQALAAYGALMTGANAAQVTDANGSKVTYSQANKDALNAYILRLQSIIQPSQPNAGAWGGPAVLTPGYGNPCGGGGLGAPLRYVF